MPTALNISACLSSNLHTSSEVELTPLVDDCVAGTGGGEARGSAGKLRPKLPLAPADDTLAAAASWAWCADAGGCCMAPLKALPSGRLTASAVRPKRPSQTSQLPR